jgi:hypothetical protein
VVGPATVQQALLAGYDDVSVLDLRYDKGSAGTPLTAAVAFGDAPPGDARAAPVAGAEIERVRLAAGSPARGSLLRVELRVPAGARLGMVRPLTSGFALATVDGRAAGSIVDVRLHYDRNWGAVWREVRHKLAAHVGVFIATALTLGVALGFAWRRAAHALAQERELSSTLATQTVP